MIFEGRVVRELEPVAGGEPLDDRRVDVRFARRGMGGRGGFVRFLDGCISGFNAPELSPPRNGLASDTLECAVTVPRKSKLST